MSRRVTELSVSARSTSSACHCVPLRPRGRVLACVIRVDEAGADGDAEVSETLADVIAAVIAASGSSGAGGSGRGTQSARRSSHWCPSGGRPGGCRVMPAAVSISFCLAFSAARRALRSAGVSVRGMGSTRSSHEREGTRISSCEVERTTRVPKMAQLR